MEHNDVVTLFHEFGHLVHHVLGGQQRWARFSGVATEWDFVEAPSQMLEEWAWDADVLRPSPSTTDGKPIPASWSRGCARPRSSARATSCARRCSTRRSRPAAPRPSGRPHRERARSAEAVRRVRLRRGTHFHASFGHLAGYTSAYYTYMWSLVIAKDLFSAFDREPARPAVARRTATRCSRPAEPRDAADLVAAFLGRPYSFDAFAPGSTRCRPGERR